VNPETAAALAAAEAGLATTTAAVATLRGLLEEPDPDPGPGSGLVLTASEVTDEQVLLTWETDRTDVASWTVGRDGTDRRGTPPWSTTLPGIERSKRFALLRPATRYVLTVTPAGGDPVQLAVTTAGTSTPEPGPGSTAQTAAERWNWGQPHPISDEFDTYTGPPDPAKWILPGQGWLGHERRGRRLAERTTVRDGQMILTALPNGDAGWVRQRMPTRYGRWELRASCDTTAPGVPWHVLALVWPTVENWPRSGELDFLEIENPEQTFYRAYLHYPHPPLPGGAVEQEIVTVPGIRPGDPHNYAFEWTPTGVAGYVDGEQVYRFAGGAGRSGRSDIQAMPEGSLTLQIDHFGSTSACTFKIEWVRFYPLTRDRP